MAKNEEYIEMEITSSPSKKEFEFQMSFASDEKQATACSADELFFKGKLLPLQNLLLHSSTTTTTAAAAFSSITKEAFEKDHKYSIPLFTCSTAPCTKTTNTPLDSCNISPSQSCRVSCELKPDDYFFEWSTELSSFINNNNRYPTKLKPYSSKKLKLIKHSILVQKLKSSTAFLKSLFAKPVVSSPNSSKAEASFKIVKKKPMELISRTAYPRIAALIDKEGIEGNNVQRKSFSGAIKRHSPTKCLSSSSSGASSSSSSFNSSGLYEMESLKRNSSATEIEVSIDAAIAHCKKSLQIL
ncbi:hypothetical protein ABFS82_12G136200 [Erythranthe guttata]|uniref:Membrane-associated kinase regulator 4 n=1 Tax=Erythranthe guttata TaxID=4155 RepID=A0A022RFG5_ERYGU|nr:PREDICTED: probable membrane-associated kinase regulator 4 [Erythranthe guttata]EYU38488.1 hypothetical protein MIMGU_mgv1a024443mg [Erythranthe guttata]|eukprot:XP_012835803.1 PREDICTED: probable membrane-associated kinase regulator 4 [Erythranthe guttata]